MLIKALCEYYDVINNNSDKNNIPDYCTEQDVHFMIMLTVEGKISDIVDIRKYVDVVQKNGKTKTIIRPNTAILPKRSQKSCIDLNIIEHRPLYIFGLNYSKDHFNPKDSTDKAKKSHKCFVEGNLEFCKEIHSPIVQAYCNFLRNWTPENECENSFLLKLGKLYSSSYYIFALDGHPDILLHEDKELMSKYSKLYEFQQKERLSNCDTSICPIEGERLPTARIHDKISGVKGGNSVGSALVCINDSAFESYGKLQSFNSNISEFAMKKYTIALNNLLSDSGHKFYADDTTVIYFSISKTDENECAFFNMLLNGDNSENIDESLKKIADEIVCGRAADLSSININENSIFYVAGLTPNSSRIAQKFVYRQKFGKIINNIVMHQKDIMIENSTNQIPLWRIYKQLISPKSTNETVPPPLISAIFNSIINGTNYPNELLYMVIYRVKVDNDDENNRFIKLNNIRAGIIKACLNRKSRLSNKKEEITMSLNVENKDPAYLCGRLFAVLEYIQQKSAGGDLNKTIKDSYFASACSKPSTVFPKLLMLAQNHIAKLDNPIYLTKLVGEIISSIEGEFPSTLSLDKQGVFIIGYYHQNNNLYTKNNNMNKGKDD